VLSVLFLCFCCVMCFVVATCFFCEEGMAFIHNLQWSLLHAGLLHFTVFLTFLYCRWVDYSSDWEISASRRSSHSHVAYIYSQWSVTTSPVWQHQWIGGLSSSTLPVMTLWMNEWMNEWIWFQWRCHRNCCRGTVQKLSSKMALSVSEEMTQWTGESLDVDRRKVFLGISRYWMVLVLVYLVIGIPNS